MAVCYNKLFHLMIDKGVTTTQLKEATGFSANIISRLKKNKYVSLESIERICAVLQCSADDVLEFSLAENNKMSGDRNEILGK